MRIYNLFLVLSVMFALPVAGQGRRSDNEKLYLVVETNSVDGVWLKFNKNYDTAPVPARLRNMPPKYLKLVNGCVVEKSTEEKAVVDLPREYRKHVNGRWYALAEDECKRVDDDRQQAKSEGLKQAENALILEAISLGSRSNRVTELSVLDVDACVRRAMELNEPYRSRHLERLMMYEFALRHLNGRPGDIQWHDEVE